MKKMKEYGYTSNNCNVILFAMESDRVSTSEELWALREQVLEEFVKDKSRLLLDDGELCSMSNCCCNYLDDWAGRCFNPKCYQFFEEHGIKVTHMLNIERNGYQIYKEETGEAVYPIGRNGYMIVIPDVKWEMEHDVLPSCLFLNANPSLDIPWPCPDDIYHGFGDFQTNWGTEEEELLNSEPKTETQFFWKRRLRLEKAIRTFIDETAAAHGVRIVSFGKPMEAYAFWEETYRQKLPDMSPQDQVNAFFKWAKPLVVSDI